MNVNTKYNHISENMACIGSLYKEIFYFEDLTITHNFSVANTFIDPMKSTQDGILGLGNDTNSIVYQLYKNKLIDKPIYSIHLLEINELSLILGSPNYEDLNLIKESSIILKYNELKAVFSYNNIKFPQKKVDFSTLIPYIIGPFDVLQSFYSDLIRNYNCFTFEDYIFCDCDLSYPSISFIFTDTNITLASKDYLLVVIFI